MQETLRKLIENYCETLARQLDDIGRHLDDLECGGACETAFDEALDLTHQINGLSGTMGYRPISAAAADLERFMRNLETSSAPPKADELTLMRMLFETLRGLGDKVAPERSTLYHADFSHLSASTAG